MLNIRSYLNFNDNYSKINREERNLAAIVYYALLHNDNVQTFLNLIGDNSTIIDDELGIYFEYSFLRDLWHNIDVKNKDNLEKQNEIKKKLILELLQPINKTELEGASVLDFNTYFGCVPNPSKIFIQSPGNWSIIGNPKTQMKGFDETIPLSNEFEKVCKFKWSFNIKPDIVIHKTRESAVCIEAKLESNEGRYPSKPSEEVVFNRRKLKKTEQTGLQKYMMEQLLGINTKFIFLVQNDKVKSHSHMTLTWSRVFKNLNTQGFHPFVSEWISSYSIVEGGENST